MITYRLARLALLLIVGACAISRAQTGSPQPESSPAPATAAATTATAPIAEWDVVPFQRFDKPLKVGVLAFHERGAKVAFTGSCFTWK